MMSVFGPGVSDLIRSFHAMIVGIYNSGFCRLRVEALLHSITQLERSTVLGWHELFSTHFLQCHELCYVAMGAVKESNV